MTSINAIYIVGAGFLPQFTTDRCSPYLYQPSTTLGHLCYPCTYLVLINLLPFLLYYLLKLS